MCPSAAAASTWFAATEPAAPFALTTIKSLPVISFAYCANTRAERSVFPPAPAGTTMETVVDGAQEVAVVSAGAASPPLSASPPPLSAAPPSAAAVVVGAAVVAAVSDPPPHPARPKPLHLLKQLPKFFFS